MDFINQEKGKRNHRDYATLKNAAKFANSLGCDNYAIKKYSYKTSCFEYMDEEEVRDVMKIVDQG